jgi:hypothetical protein
MYIKPTPNPYIYPLPHTHNHIHTHTYPYIHTGQHHPGGGRAGGRLVRRGGEPQIPANTTKYTQIYDYFQQIRPNIRPNTTKYHMLHTTAMLTTVSTMCIKHCNIY